MYMEDWSYSFTLSEPRHKMEVSGQFHVLATLPTAKKSHYSFNSSSTSSDKRAN
jgi:hypothetical protein